MRKTVNLLSLAKESAKHIFKLIRKDGEFFCPALNSNVCITRKFLQHICYNHKKDRDAQKFSLVVIIEKKEEQNVLLSCFKNEKRGLSLVCRTPHHHPKDDSNLF